MNEYDFMMLMADRTDVRQDREQSSLAADSAAPSTATTRLPPPPACPAGRAWWARRGVRLSAHVPMSKMGSVEAQSDKGLHGVSERKLGGRRAF